MWVYELIVAYQVVDYENGDFTADRRLSGRVVCDNPVDGFEF